MNNKIIIKVMKKKPELSDEEIQSHMNFEKLLKMHPITSPVGSLPKWIIHSSYLLPAALIISTVIYMSVPRNTPQPINHNISKSPPVYLKDSLNKIENEKLTEPKLESQPAVIEPEPTKERETEKLAIESAQHLPAEIRRSKPQFTEAEPLDGYPALYEYFNRELKYPQDVAADTLEGIVTVSFAININGKPDEIKIINSLGEAFDKECIRIIMDMPAWKPATINGKYTSVRLSIPLTFQAKKIKK